MSFQVLAGKTQTACASFKTLEEAEEFVSNGSFWTIPPTIVEVDTTKIDALNAHINGYSH